MTDRITILGTGAVGLTLAFRLARGGVRVTVVPRRREAVAAFDDGIVAEDPATGATQRQTVHATADVPDGAPVVICAISAGLDDAARRIARTNARLPTVTLQNGVGHEARVAETLENVIGGVWRQTATRLGPARVRFPIDAPARAIVGAHTAGARSHADPIAQRLRRGDIDVGVSDEIAADKWLKLCVNLTSAPNALVRQVDHGDPRFPALKVRLLEEARGAISAAGVRARSCDGRDRSLDDEIAFHAGAHARGDAARPLPLYNQVWASLTHGTPLEADAYHRRIIALAEAHDLPIDANRRVLAALLDAAERATGPEGLTVADFD